MHSSQWIMIGVVSVWCCAVARGDGFRNPPEGAAALGRGGVRYVYADDLTVITHNPANLTDFTRAAITPSLTFTYAPTDYTAPDGTVESAEDAPGMIPAFYGAIPLGDGRCVLGLGVHSPYGQATEWKADGVFTGRAPYDASLMTVNVGPALGVKLTERLSVGAGLSLMFGALEFSQAMPGVPLPDGTTAPGSRLTFDADGTAVGGNFGLTFQVSASQRVAVSYRAPVSLTMNGDFEMKHPPPPELMPPGFRPTADFSTQVKFPSIVGLGYGIELGRELRVEANLEWIEHSRNTALALDLGLLTPLLADAFGADAAIPQAWEDTWSFGLGADWACAEHWIVRGGWTWLPSPVPDATFSPVLPEDDKHIVGVGVGYRAGRHTVDAAYSYSFQATRRIAEGMVAGTYEAEPHLAAVSYTCLF